ncbi:MAG TPA: transposase [Aggregatilineales bacterium]|nr:transposase [Aggregatilineales bacterium]
MNAACNWISEQAWQTQTFNTVRLHHQVYYPVREQFDLTAQVVVRGIGKVSNAYKTRRKTIVRFKKLGAVIYDDRILYWHTDEVSIWTLMGRQKIRFVCGEQQQWLLQYQHGESDLIYRKGDFYLMATCDVPEDAAIDPEGFLGVDLGIKNIAVDSDGNIHSARHLLNVRHRHRRLRRKLQQKRTWSALRKLKALSGKERRFARDVNHCISKRLVHIAKDTGRGIALEDLKGIRDRVTFPRKRRNTLHSWSFGDLRFKIEYKAHHTGVPVALVDPRNTSRECSCCHHIDKANRVTQSSFKCTSCGFVSHADVNAAINIGCRASVNTPYADRVLGANPA